MIAGRAPVRIDAWALYAIAVSVLLAVPVVVVAASLLTPFSDAWVHLAATVLPLYVRNSVWLMLGVGSGVAVIGVATAWLTTMTRFPGVRQFEWALILPLAMPAYVIGYTYTGLMDFAGPVQSALRAAFGWSAQDYWFPQVRSLPGAMAMLILVFYPYVYLLARSAFMDQSVCAIEVSRTLGRTPWQSFLHVSLPLARPAIIGGVALALMETLGDFGTVQYFGVDTFTTGIYRTWLGMGEPLTAAQLAAILLFIVFGLLLLERWSRGARRYHHTSAYHRALPTYRLRGLKIAAAWLTCALPVLLGFAIPAAALIYAAIDNAALSFDAAYLRLVVNTLWLAGSGALVTVVIAATLAYAARFGHTSVVRGAARFAAMGYAVPGTVLAVGIMLPFVWLDNRLDDFMRATFGLSTGLLLSGTLAAVVFGYAVRFLAVGLNPIEAALARVTPSIAGAARVLGASPPEALLRVHVPLVSGGVATAAILLLVEIIKELPATLLMRPFNFDTLAIRTYQMASDERLAEAALPALTIVAVGLIPVILLSQALARSRPGHARR
ncbi:MAG TPA: iron ABC transporter permease [Alphaproteobacteria bacterium]|nr:iron ABC transporter permease [Alphaproteobacteria bacterium]